MKDAIKHWLLILLLLLDEAIVFILVLLVLQLFGVKLSLPLVIVIALLGGGIVFVSYKVILPALRRKNVTGMEGMVGLEGRVIEPLTPVGIIKVGNESWKARSLTGEIGYGERVEILGSNGLTLQVRLKS